MTQSKLFFMQVLNRGIQTSAVQKDVEAAAKFIGAGAATVGMAGSGAGIGTVLQLHHRLRPKPLVEATALHLCHSGICVIRSYGALLSYGSFLDSVCSVD